MSEFKYACPVCGQHIKCDSSQVGTVMQCPTCFQKITVPQAPASDEQKLIITGTKAGNGRPPPKSPESGSAPPPQKGFSGAAVVFIILICIVAAVAFVYHGTIFKSAKPPPAGQTTTSQKKLPPKPALVAPPANDTNWTLNLSATTIPDSTAAGQIAGRDFICNHAIFQNSYLIMEDRDLTFSINFGGAKIETLAGKSLNITTNTTMAARVNMRWKEGDQFMRETFTNDYAMRLDFGEVTNNRIAVKIYLCTSDEKKSYVAGTFHAEIRKPRPRKQ
jgi:DNA-directed RNA polymerase subunit RPC12/RpoP